MSRKRYELTWHKPRNCWSKFYRGRRYYCSIKCSGKTDSDGYARSVQWWRSTKNCIDAAHGDAGRDSLGVVSGDGEMKFPPGLHFMMFKPFLENFQPLFESDGPVATIEDLIEAYLKMCQQRAGCGSMTVGTYEDIFTKLKTFREFLTDYCEVLHRSVSELLGMTSEILSTYRLAVEADLNAGKIKATTAKKRLGYVKAMFEWGYQNHRIETLPRVISKSYPKVAPIGIPTPRRFELHQIHTLFDAASQRTRLYIALALNCGWNAIDIATFTHEMMNWGTGILSRERKKNRVPSSFRLWPVTRELLKAEMTPPRHQGLMLLGQNGHPLVHQGIRKDGTPESRKNAIRLAFDRVKKKTNLNNAPSFKSFRATSGQNLREKYPTEIEVVDGFLAHAEQNRVRNYYTTRPVEIIHKACDYLDTVYKLGAR